MSCICQYFVHSKDHHASEDSTCVHKDGTTTENSDPSIESSSKSDISASDVVTVRAENWLLNKNLREAHITIENLEGLIKTIMEKQNGMLTEMYHLKRLNQDLEEECRLQRDYHAMERNAMVRELQDVKELLQKRSKLLEEALQKNSELTNDVQDVNQKIYLMGMKYLRLKNDHSYHSSEESDADASSEQLSFNVSSAEEHSE